LRGLRRGEREKEKSCISASILRLARNRLAPSRWIAFALPLECKTTLPPPPPRQKSQNDGVCQTGAVPANVKITPLELFSLIKYFININTGECGKNIVHPLRTNKMAAI
jgi:hypothetical protein